MALSWNEIRTRAVAFSNEWKGKGYEKGETQLFYQGFFKVFGLPVARIASFERPVRILGGRRGYIDLFWKGKLMVEQKSKGRDLTKAMNQLYDYFPGLDDDELPRFVMTSDFQTFELQELGSDEIFRCTLSEFPDHVRKFGFIIEDETYSLEDQCPVDVEASRLMGELHDSLQDSGYSGHDLERFLVRIVFCLFADSTGIFEPPLSFRRFVETRTREDGTDVGGFLATLFQTLNTKIEEREKTIDEDLNKFCYVNGDLFQENLRLPSFNSEMRIHLLEACRFNWSEVSPAIFGSLFQSVMNRRERREQGAHYTTEDNILRVIDPLFMNDLRAEFSKLKARRDNRRRKMLIEFQKRISEMTFFDPACGCGNFLVITYRELRQLEMDVVRELMDYKRDAHGEFESRLDISELSLVNVDQFYGIEIGEFPVRIAETAMWMMDHIMNNKLSDEFGKNYLRIPLTRSPTIRHGDALELDWNDVLPSYNCSYILGNPPFSGSKKQSEEKSKQRAQVLRLSGSSKRGTLDYVAAWFLKAGEYVNGRRVGIGFVSTNSITQGQQVAELWPILFDKYQLEISFGHRTFMWNSDIGGKAQVHVVIIGLISRNFAPKSRLLFSYDHVDDGEPDVSTHEALSPHLFGAVGIFDPHLVVRESHSPQNGLPRMIVGSQPIDGGNYIFSTDEKEEFLKVEPNAAPFFRPYIGSDEFVRGTTRWILMLSDAPPETLKKLKHVQKRINSVRKFRSGSRTTQTQELARTPLLYNRTVIPAASFLVVPRHTTEKREYIPIGWIDPPTIPSDAISLVADADLSLFGLITSAMHMSWMRHIGGRIKSDYRYSAGMVYNTFPLSPAGVDGLSVLEPFAQDVLDARAAHPNTSYAALYHPAAMPSNLLKAHHALDRKVDRLYRRKAFESDRDRSEYLFGLYEKATSPLANGTGKRQNRKRASKK